YVPKVAALRFSMTQFYVCAVLSLITIIPFSQGFMQNTPFYETFTFDGMAEGIVPLLYTGILSSGVAYTLQIVGQKGVAPAKAAIIFSCESLFGALGGWLFAGEVMTPRSYIGCALMFCGIIASQLQIGKKRRKERLEEELNKV
ncbi:MAG: DMT family transporter, partial [Oscillospiraceae bacterium]|nr:DMT family transporter [Oscillospiraceae bacterium]